MLPASNSGVGMSVGFPDPCLTPTPAGPVPIPYPNIGANAMSLGFVPNVFVSCVPATNMATKIVMTSGDEGGVAHPMFKGPGGYTMGMPNILVGGLPGVTVAMPTNGNNFNNPIGVVAVPSAVNVLYNRVPEADTDGTGAVALATELDSSGDAVESSVAADGSLVVHIHAFTRDTASGLMRELDRHADAAAHGLELDLRDNRGGELDAALRVAGLFLPVDTELATITRHDGARVVRNPQPARYHMPLLVRVNADTASAAETVATILATHHRARIVGGPTRGKTTITDHAGTVIGTITF